MAGSLTGAAGRKFVLLALVAGLLNGCAVAAVADAAVVTGATVVKAGVSVVGATVDVARAGVRAVTRSDDHNK
jgi:hypothetical protein